MFSFDHELSLLSHILSIRMYTLLHGKYTVLYSIACEKMQQRPFFFSFVDSNARAGWISLSKCFLTEAYVLITMSV